MPTITIVELEEAINRCKAAQPPVDCVLGPDLRVLATVWGQMIYHHQGSLELVAQKSADRQVIERWLAKVADAGASCPMAGMEGCEACQ